MRKLILALAVVAFGSSGALACTYMKDDVAQTPKPIVTADGKVITPAAPTQTPMPDKTGS